MNILQRIKDGANRATEKAQGAVEVSKLNGQIAEVEKEMELHFMEMGRSFYEGYSDENMSRAEKEMLKHCKACDELKLEIDELRRRIAELKNEKLCKCGRTVQLDANFCPSCGRSLKEGQTPRRHDDSRDAGATMFQEDDFGETKIYKEPAQDDEFNFDHVYGKDETGASEERNYDYDLAPGKEWDAMEEDSPADERERLKEDELERERERQLELDRRIRFWKENNEGETEAPVSGSPRETVKCQICRAELPKGSKWCPRCGAEQI